MAEPGGPGPDRGAGDLEMRSAFSVSYRHLTPQARAVFRRLALAPGPDFSTELATVLAGTDAAAVEAALEEVADASLIEPAPAPGRYRFHDLVRLFAAERLASEEAPEERRSAEDRMLTALTGAAIEAGHMIGPPGEERWTATPPDRSLASFTTRAEAISWLDAEFANWFGAARRCAAAHRHGDVLGLACAMHWYADSRSRRAEWGELFECALAAARALGDRWHVAYLVNSLGWQAAVAGRWDDTLEHHRRALMVARETGHRQEEGWSLNYTGIALAETGHWAGAIEELNAAARIFDEAAYRTGQCVVRLNLGIALARSGHPDQAVGHIDQALAARADLAHPPFLAMALGHRGRVLADLGRWAEAAESYQAAIPVLREEGDQIWLARFLRDLGLAELGLARRDDAAGTLRQAFEAYAGVSDRQGQEEVLEILERITGDAVSPA